MTDGPLPKLLMVREAAEVLRCSAMTIYRLIAAGELTGVRVGKHWRIRETDVRDYIGNQ